MHLGLPFVVHRASTPQILLYRNNHQQLEPENEPDRHAKKWQLPLDEHINVAGEIRAC